MDEPYEWEDDEGPTLREISEGGDLYGGDHEDD